MEEILARVAKEVHRQDVRDAEEVPRPVRPTDDGMIVDAPGVSLPRLGIEYLRELAGLNQRLFGGFSSRLSEQENRNRHRKRTPHGRILGRGPALANPMGRSNMQPMNWTSLASYNFLYACEPKRQRTAALQDADAPFDAPELAERFGVRLSSAAFGVAGKLLAVLRHSTGPRSYLITVLNVCFAFWSPAVADQVATNRSHASSPRIISFSSAGTVVANWRGKETTLQKGQSLGPWTLMAAIQPAPHLRLAVFEDFSQTNGHLLFADKQGVTADLPKSSEPTWADPKTLYRGHRLEEVVSSEGDLLGEEILAKPGDPDYAEVASCFAPITKMYTYSFVGTHDCLEKVGVFYGGATPNLDPAAYIPEIRKVREAGHVLDGLVGGWLPALRFVYPERPGAWSELVIYAPLRVEEGNQRVQPVWYRLCRIEDNALRWVRYFDSYHPFPPRLEAKAEAFYEELLAMRAGWQQTLAQGMEIDIPDQRLADMARHSLVREMITRVGSYPKYGVFDRGYGGSEHDGFPDTFTVDTAAMLAWGLSDLAGQYFDNYFRYFVRDDGSILYRGPETGQYGRMLTVAAQYADYTGDYQLLLRHRRRLDAVAKLLLSLRTQALRLPQDAAAYGMITGWSEADACLDPDPPRYMQPYFSNSTEAARGFEDLGRVWESIGARKHLPELAAWGQQLRQEGRALATDIQTAITRSMLTNTTPACLPSIAGVSEPFHVAVDRDKLDPAVPLLPRLDGDALLGQPHPRSGRDHCSTTAQRTTTSSSVCQPFMAITRTSGAGS